MCGTKFIMGTMNVMLIMTVLCWTSIECKTLKELSEEVDAIHYELARLIYNHGRTVNYALHKKASQSSVYTNEYNRGPGAAVDGNMNGDFKGRSCIHTKAESNPWWMVDFGEGIYIGRVVIKNRADCCGERLRNFRISLGQTKDGHYATFGTFKGVATNGEIITVEKLNKGFGRYLKIEQNGDRETLNFCEVQVFYA